MILTSDNKLRKLIVIGDRVLIKPQVPSDKTTTGLYLPQGFQEKETVQTGYVIKTGPGYPLPSVDFDETWKPDDEKIKYLPLQAQEGDLAIYLQKSAVEVVFEGEKYVIVQQHAIVMLVREQAL
ncbi:MAG: co-chaperone GroES [Bacteroidia bacterium]